MIIKGDLIHHHDTEAYDIMADEKLYWMIFDDMLQNGGKFVPLSCWQNIDNSVVTPTERFEELLFSNEEMKTHALETIKKYPGLSSLFSPWLGASGRISTMDEKLLDYCRDYLLDLGDVSFFDTLRNSEFYQKTSDYKTILEISFINTVITNTSKLNVLEIGGGYGRLAEGILNVYSGQSAIFLADSVPISLMYSYLYLK